MNQAENNRTTETKLSATQQQIQQVCDELAAFLIQKNRDYGDSALSPKRIFSRLDSAEAIKIRIDDKLSRISNDQVTIKEDSVWDLMGYLVLLRVAHLREKQAKESPVVIIGLDGKCGCCVGDACPLGKRGSAYRCTKEELESAGFRTAQK